MPPSPASDSRHDPSPVASRLSPVPSFECPFPTPRFSYPVPRMRAVFKGVKRISRFSSFATRLQDRFARSSRVFLIGLLVACGIEVIVDWNQTLREVTVLRDRMRERGTSYVSMLASAVEKPLIEGDNKELVRLADGLFDDDDVCFVRILDAEGRTLHERVAKEYEK